MLITLSGCNRISYTCAARQVDVLALCWMQISFDGCHYYLTGRDGGLVWGVTKRFKDIREIKKGCLQHLVSL